MHRHLKSVPSIQEIGTTNPQYRPTYRFWGRYLDRFHRHLGTAPMRRDNLIEVRTHYPKEGEGLLIEGWMTRPEALKLYELARFAEGDILEIGSYQGLSTYIMAKAINNSRHKQRRIYSLDIFLAAIRMARFHLYLGKLHQYARFVLGDAYSVTNSYAHTGKKFAFAFIDFSHEYHHVYEVCTLLYQVMQPGSFVLFHDYNDPRNVDPKEPDYGVYQAAADGLNPRYFDFYGMYGSMGLYRVKE